MVLEHYLQELAQGEEPPKHALLAQLSGLNGEEMETVRQWWPSMPGERRRKLIDRLVGLAEDSVELDFSAIFRLCLTDADPDVRERAVFGLWESDDRHLIGPLMALLKHDPTEKVRASAAMALGRFCSLAQVGKLLARDGDRIKELLLPVVQNSGESVEVRRRALEAIACFNTSPIRDLIKWAYDGGEPRLRTSALFSMGRTCDPVWLPTLISEMRSKDPAMRYEAASACAELGEEEAVPYLATLIHDEDPQVQLAAIQGLGAIGGTLAGRTLRQCLKSDDESVREMARDVLEQLQFGEEPLSFKFRRT